MGPYFILLVALISIIAGRINKFAGGLIGAVLTAVLAIWGSSVYDQGTLVPFFSLGLERLVFITIIVLLYLFNGWQILTGIDLSERLSSLNSTALTLIPLAIAINIAGGQIIKALRLPIYLDSIGTVLAGALLGPWIGLLTGLLSNTIWTLIGLDAYAYAFAIVAGVIGLLAGFAGRAGLFQRQSPPWLSALIGAVFLLALSIFVLMFLTATPNADNSGMVFLSIPELFAGYPAVFIGALLLGAVAGFFVLKNAGYAGLAGLLTGVVAALISAPIVTYLFGGVTGSGTDVLVIAFRDAGASILNSALAQGTVSDPFDKMTSFMVVFLIIQSLPKRLLQRFPNARAVQERARIGRPAPSR